MRVAIDIGKGEVRGGRPGCAAGRARADPNLSGVVVTDSVPSFRLPAGGPAARKLRVASAVPLFAQAIRDSHRAWLR